MPKMNSIQKLNKVIDDNQALVSHDEPVQVYPSIARQKELVKMSLQQVAEGLVKGTVTPEEYLWFVSLAKAQMPAALPVPETQAPIAAKKQVKKVLKKPAPKAEKKEDKRKSPEFIAHLRKLAKAQHDAAVARKAKAAKKEKVA